MYNVTRSTKYTVETQLGEYSTTLFPIVYIKESVHRKNRLQALFDHQKTSL